MCVSVCVLQSYGCVVSQVHKFPIHNPDVTHLTFRVFDKDINSDDFIAYASIPVTCVKPGWRTIQLFDANGSCLADFEHAKLFVRIAIESGLTATFPKKRA